MRKALKDSNLYERRGAKIRVVVGLALIASLSIFGCTTNRTHAEGEPYIGGPSVGPSSPTSNSGSSVPTTPQPMTSSYRGSEQSEFTAPRPHRLTPDEAALVMADHLPKVRVLGPADPGTAVRPYVSASIVTGQVSIGGLTPVTANTTLNSPATPSITSGADLNGVVSAAPTITGNLATVTPTNAAIAVTPGTFAGGSAATVTGTTSTNATPTAAATTTTTTNTATPAATSLNTNVTANGNVQVVSANGKLMVTNVSSSSRRQ